MSDQLDPAAILLRVEKLWSLSMQGQAASVEDTCFLASTLRTALAELETRTNVYKEVMGRMHDACHRHKLGLGGEHVDHLVVEALDTALADTRRVDYISNPSHSTEHYVWSSSGWAIRRRTHFSPITQGWATLREAIDFAMTTSEGGEAPCPTREDKQHCDHWYDGEACCACGDNPPTENDAAMVATEDTTPPEQRRAQPKVACPVCGDQYAVGFGMTSHMKHKHPAMAATPRENNDR